MYIPIILIYIFNKYFEPYLLLALILYVSLGIWRSWSFIPLKTPCSYSIKFQIYFIHIWPGCTEITPLVNEVHLVSAKHPANSCTVNLPLEAGQSWPIIPLSIPCFVPPPFIAHKKEGSQVTSLLMCTRVFSAIMLWYQALNSYICWLRGIHRLVYLYFYSCTLIYFKTKCTLISFWGLCIIILKIWFLKCLNWMF